MLDNLTQRMARVVKTLRGEARLTEANTQEMLREVRLALLEADVALPVVREFIAKVKEKALGEEVISSLSPGQALVGVVQRELTAIIGGDYEGKAVELNLAVTPPAVILMAGLQGAGKTTTVGKLAKLLREKYKKKVLTVSCDVYRPAAIAQLKTVTEQVGADFFPSRTGSEAGRHRARRRGLGQAPLSRRADRRHGRPSRHRRSDDAGNRRAAQHAEAGGNAVRRRRDARPGRGQHRQGLQRRAAAHRRGAHQARRRLARRRGALRAPCHGQADQVRRRRGKARRPRSLLPGSHGEPDSRHGRHSRPRRRSAARRRRAGRAEARRQGQERRRLRPERFPRAADANEEAWAACRR